MTIARAVSLRPPRNWPRACQSRCVHARRHVQCTLDGDDLDCGSVSRRQRVRAASKRSAPPSMTPDQRKHRCATRSSSSWFLGVLGAFGSAYVYAVPSKPLPPVFNPAPNPYAQGIYANGIIESYQANRRRTSTSTRRCPGRSCAILVAEGQAVTQGHAARADRRLGAARDRRSSRSRRPRPRTRCSRSCARSHARRSSRSREAQVELGAGEREERVGPVRATAALVRHRSRVVSKVALDNAGNARRVAQANFDVVTRQYELTKAGAWVFDIRNQEKQAEALAKAYAASSALLAKYTLKAPTTASSCRSTRRPAATSRRRAPTTRTREGFGPLVVMGDGERTLAVRCYIDEILIPRLPPRRQVQAQMFIRGTEHQSAARVRAHAAVRVAEDPALERAAGEGGSARAAGASSAFSRRPACSLPGQLVDVYLGEK